MDFKYKIADVAKEFGVPAKKVIETVSGVTFCAAALAELFLLGAFAVNFAGLFFGNVFSNGTIFPEQRIRPLPTDTFVI